MNDVLELCSMPVGTRSRTRRRDILEAALRCFSKRGYAATTMREIRRASRASIGSLYHHFGSKEELAGALYLEGLRSYHESLLASIEAFESAESLVKGIVRHHVEWIVSHREWARYLIEMRRAESIVTRDREIRALTRRHLARLREQVDPFVARGALSKLSDELLASILTGPAQSLAAHWVPRGRWDELAAAAPTLAEAAWRALKDPL